MQIFLNFWQIIKRPAVLNSWQSNWFVGPASSPGLTARFLISIGIATLGCSCAWSEAEKGPNSFHVNESEYSNLISNFTRTSRQYKGFHNTFQIHATLLNSRVRQAMLRRDQEYYQWDESHYQKQREQAFQEMSNSTRVIVSLFSPDREYVDMAKTKSAWRSYLLYDGKRYAGTAKRSHRKMNELLNLLPYHDRWSRAYELNFAVPTQMIEEKSVMILISSSLGQAELTYPALATQVVQAGGH